MLRGQRFAPQARCKGEIDPKFLITHRPPFGRAPHGCEVFKHNKDKCTNVVLKP